MSFANNVANFQNVTVTRELSRVYRMSLFDLFTAIVFSTPVDKGVLRNNWFLELGMFNDSVTDQGSLDGAGPLARARTTLAMTTITDPVFISNNSDYAEPIEFDGHSAQAPNGMLRINLARWSSIVSSNGG